MKDERHVRQRRAAGARWRPAAILLAAVLVFLSLPLAGKAVYAVDLTPGSCSLTVNVGASMSEADKADIQDANLVVDLYQIAKAQPLNGYDTYNLSLNEPYNSPDAGIDISGELDSNGWKMVAQQAAKYALGTVPEGTESMAPSPASTYVTKTAGSGTPAGTIIKNLDPGLYLIVIHGRDDAEYVSTKTNEAGESSLVTTANSHVYHYSFSPELIALPTKAAVDGVINTANPGAWDSNGLADFEISVKFDREERIGSLRIIKQLDTYAQREKGENLTNDQATFIFEVTVKASAAENAETVYHDMVSITFDANSGTSEKSILIENLPVDSIATVKEIYPDPDAGNELYTQIKADTDAKTILANDIVNAEFENDYNDRNNGGGSVTNNFKYTEGENDYDATWGWHQVTDNSETGTVVQPAEE